MRKVHTSEKVSRELNLTFEQWFEISLKPCHWCGGTLPEVGHGMDRLDNEQGYSAENCVPPCATCNRNRGKMAPQDFIAWIIKVHAHQVKNK